MQKNIVIIGANLTGLTTALALCKFNFDITLVDNRAIGKKTNDGRAIAISYGSKQILEDSGIWKHLANKAGKIDEIRVTDEYSPLHLHFNKNETLGYLVESDDLLETLYNLATQEKRIKIFDNSNYEIVENTKDKASIKINQDLLISAEIIIAADGKFSKLREICNIKTFEHDYQQYAIVCKVEHQKVHNNIAQEFFQANGPFAVLPLKSRNKSGIVWTEAPETAQTLMKLSQQEIEYFLKQKFTDYLGEIKLLSLPISYPLKLILASKYYKDRIILVGDSAHSIHPIAGQGFNLALRDIESLKSLIQKYSSIGYLIGNEQMMIEYEKNRKIDNNSMAAITHGLNSLFATQIKSVKKIRKLGLHIVNKFPKLKSFFMNYAMHKKSN